MFNKQLLANLSYGMGAPSPVNLQLSESEKSLAQRLPFKGETPDMEKAVVATLTGNDKTRTRKEGDVIVTSLYAEVEYVAQGCSFQRYVKANASMAVSIYEEQACFIAGQRCYVIFLAWEINGYTGVSPVAYGKMFSVKDFLV